MLHVKNAGVKNLSLINRDAVRKSLKCMQYEFNCNTNAYDLQSATLNAVDNNEEGNIPNIPNISPINNLEHPSPAPPRSPPHPPPLP